MFRKFASLENHYNINKSYLDLSEEVIVSEKIDGSNFSLVIEEDGSYRYASRNQLVDANWNGVDELVPKNSLEELIKMYKGHEVNLYGEVFSSKILRRIPYGETKLRFFSLAIDGEYIPSNLSLPMLLDIGFEIVPYVTMTLQEALEVDVETHKTAFAKDSIAEGIVIMPAHRDKFNDRVFGIKYKSSAFVEKSKVNKKPKELSPLATKFSEYVNENRLQSYISKTGEITDKSQIGEYVKGIIDDAWEDFIKEVDVDFETGGSKKGITGSSGSIIAQMLLKRIKV